MKTFLTILTLLISNTLLAKNHILATVTNSMDSGQYVLSVTSDDSGALVSFHVIENGTQDEAYDMSEVKKGILLVEREGREIVTMKGKRLDVIAGGVVSISYLNNAILKKHKEKKFDIFSQDGKWVILDSNSQKTVHKIHFTAKKYFGKVVGLDKMIIH